MTASTARLQLLLVVLGAGCARAPDGGRRVQQTFDVRSTEELLGARDRVRALAPAMTGDLVIALEPGDYVLDEPLALDERDSGTNGFVVSYRAAGEPGSARLLGGRPIVGWRPYAGPIVAAHVDRVVHTLYEDGVRAELARYPDRDASQPMSRAGYLTTVDGTSDRLEYAPGDLPASITDPHGLSVVVWSGGGRAWFTDVVPVAAIDRDAHVLELAHPTRYPIGTGARYFVQGPAALLDAPGELAVDDATHTLYYWPRSPAPREVIAPALDTLVIVRGSSPVTPVHDLELRGLALAATDFTAWYRFGWPAAGDSGEPHVVPEFDRQIEMPEHRLGTVTLENTERVAVIDSRIEDAGRAGIYLLFHNEQALVYGNLVAHTGLDGIAVQGGYPGEGDVSGGHVIANNLVHHVGELAGHGAGIDISNSGGNLIANDWIHDSPRYGVVIHAAAGIPGDLIYARDNEVTDVAIEATCQDSGDTAALYTFGLSHDATPRSNTFRRIAIAGERADPTMRDLPPDGVFTDDDSAGQELEDIRVTGTPGAPYRSNAPVQHVSNVSWQAGYDDTRLGAVGLLPDFPLGYRGR